MIKVTYNISNWSLSFKFSWSLEIKESDRIGILNSWSTGNRIVQWPIKVNMEELSEETADETTLREIEERLQEKREALKRFDERDFGNNIRRQRRQRKTRF